MFRREAEARVIAVNGLVKLLFIALKVMYTPMCVGFAFVCVNSHVCFDR